MLPYFYASTKNQQNIHNSTKVPLPNTPGCQIILHTGASKGMWAGTHRGGRTRETVLPQSWSLAAKETSMTPALPKTFPSHSGSAHKPGDPRHGRRALHHHALRGDNNTIKGSSTQDTKNPAGTSNKDKGTKYTSGRSSGGWKVLVVQCIQKQRR